MEIKCDICGTINDGSTNFCKGCFQKLDAKRKENVVAPDDSVVSVIEHEEVKTVPWNNDELVENVVPDPTPVIDNWELTGVNGETKKEEPAEDVTIEDSLEKTEVLDFNELPKTEITKVEKPIIINTNENVMESSEPEITEDLPNNIIEENDVINVQEVVTNEQSENNSGLTEPEETLENPAEIIEPIVETEVTTVEPIEDNSEIQKDVNEEIEEIIEPISELGEEPIDSVKTDIINDDWSKDPVEEPIVNKKEPSYVLKFALTYLIIMIGVFGTLILTTKYLDKIFDNVTSDVVSFAIYRLAALLVLIISAIITFKKQVPSIEKMNNVTFKILGFIALPSILVQLFVLGFIKNTKVLMFIVGVMLSLIILVIFFSYMRNIIKRKNQAHIDDKVFFIYGIINIILINGLLGLGIYARSNNLDMPKVNFLYDVFNDVESNTEIIESFIGQVQLKILEDQELIEDYQFPDVISDVNYAAYDEYVPDQINLKLSDTGSIINGTIVYRGITYIYDGEQIKVK